MYILANAQIQKILVDVDFYLGYDDKVGVFTNDGSLNLVGKAALKKIKGKV